MSDVQYETADIIDDFRSRLNGGDDRFSAAPKAAFIDELYKVEALGKRATWNGLINGLGKLGLGYAVTPPNRHSDKEVGYLYDLKNPALCVRAAQVDEIMANERLEQITGSRLQNALDNVWRRGVQVLSVVMNTRVTLGDGKVRQVVAGNLDDPDVTMIAILPGASKTAAQPTATPSLRPTASAAPPRQHDPSDDAVMMPRGWRAPPAEQVQLADGRRMTVTNGEATADVDLDRRIIMTPTSRADMDAEKSRVMVAAMAPESAAVNMTRKKEAFEILHTVVKSNGNLDRLSARARETLLSDAAVYAATLPRSDPQAVKVQAFIAARETRAVAVSRAPVPQTPEPSSPGYGMRR